MSWRLKRIVATTLLLYALADFTVPGFCHGDDAILTPLASTGLTHEQATNADGSAPSSSQSVGEDDCFCCCWHIVPTVTSLTIGIIDAGFAGRLSDLSYFRLLADPFFHPPRA